MSTQAARIAKGKEDAEKIFPMVKEKFPDAVLEESMPAKNADPFLVIEPASLHEVCEYLKNESELNFNLLHTVSTADFLGGDDEEGRIEVTYFLDSTEHVHRLNLKVKLPREGGSVPSVCDLWQTANWHEREAFDLMGVHFEGHPNLVRILCAEDWEGHPLRKDYVIPESFHGIKNIVY